MKSISEGLGFEKLVTLASTEPRTVAEQKTIKKTPEVERVSPEELEYAYIKHAITFNSINKSLQTIMTAGWELRCKDEKIKKFFENFIEKVGEVGENVTFEEILESIFKYQMIYGNSYLETVLGKNTKNPNNIVDLVILDPKRIDYVKLSDGKIALDKFGKPMGYIQKWPFEVDVRDKGDPIPLGSNLSLNQNEIFLLPERICHFKLHTYGDRFYGLGIIEPGYKSILYEMVIKKAHANSMDQKGEGVFIDYVGDTFHEPTPQQITNAVENMKKFKSNRYFAFPYWHNIQSIETKFNSILESLKYLREDIGASLGMPMAFATGSGEKTNRATLATQHRFLTLTLNDMVSKTLAVLKKNIFKRICKFNHFDEVPEIIWGHIGVEEINEKAKRIISYVDKEIITSDEAKPYVIKSEKLELKEE